jgi:hypothetical protein
MKRYQRPSFLDDVITQDVYERWLQRKAQAHVKRDRRRGNETCSVSSYKQAIHNAVVSSNGIDAYTLEPLEWNLVSTNDNVESNKHGRNYKARFALLPTVDHVGDGTGQAYFVICAWRTNDAKNDLSYEEFISLCKKVVAANIMLSETQSKLIDPGHRKA